MNPFLIDEYSEEFQKLNLMGYEFSAWFLGTWIDMENHLQGLTVIKLTSRLFIFVPGFDSLFNFHASK